MSHWRYIALLFLTIGQLSYSQVKPLPEDLTLFERLEQYHTPSLFQDAPSIAIGYQGQTGSFSEIREFYGYGGLHLNKKKNHGIAFGIFSNQEGPLITDNKLDLSYWKMIELSKEWEWSISGKLGIINKSLGATKSTAGASAFAPNIGISQTLTKKSTSFSLALNQIGNFKIQPLSQEFTYLRILSSQLSHTFSFNPYIDMNIYINTKIITNHTPLIQTKAELIFNEIIKPGLGINNNGLLASFSWAKIPISTKNLEITFSSEIPLFNNINSSFMPPYQIHLTYLIDKK